MSRATTPLLLPTPNARDLATPSTPGAHQATSSSAMRVQRNTAAPSTPGGHHRRISSVPRTPGASRLICSASVGVFTRVTVHTAKCSECDLRNKGTMLRCPGCTFQVCEGCQERRDRAGRSLAHGNMLSVWVATPGTGGSVVRRRLVGMVRSGVEEGEGGDEEIGAGEEQGESVEMKGKKRLMKPALEVKPKLRTKARDATPSDDSSDDDFAPDPASPTSNKRRRAKLTSKSDGIFDVPSPFLRPTNTVKDVPRLSLGDSKATDKAFSDMTIDELLAHHGVNTSTNPYKAHLLSRHEPVVSNPVVEMPEAVKRGFKARPRAEEMQKEIQDKVREKMGLREWTAGKDGSG